MTEATPSKTPWELATVVSVRDETKRAKTFRLALPLPSGHRAGQHYVLRLTAPDGYSAMRSYSVASAPDESNEFEVTVELLPGGEVSGFLHEDLLVGDEIEVRGPIGGWFVWDADAPAVLIAGGSGVVPIMAMLRLARRLERTDLVRALVSVRTLDDLFYAGEIDGPETSLVYTRTAPAGATRTPGRITVEDISPLVTEGATTYICGSTGFANAASEMAVAAGVPADRLRIERFGPTG